jgi:hypothetical protein
VSSVSPDDLLVSALECATYMDYIALCRFIVDGYI